jgi:hypothetical protein
MGVRTPTSREEERGEGVGALGASEPPDRGDGGLLLSLAEGAVFPPVALGLGPGMERHSLLLGGASDIPKGDIARLDCRDNRETRPPAL